MGDRGWSWSSRSGAHWLGFAIPVAATLACGSGPAASSGASCTPGATCAPQACHKGTVQCLDGKASCIDEGPAPDATACGSTSVCVSGICDSCSDGAACAPSTPCHDGVMACAPAPVCNPTTPSPDGGACGTNSTCSSGMCVYTWGGSVTVTSPPPLASAPCAGPAVVVTITAAGPVPRDVSVSGVGCVTFVNDDTVPHWMNSDPHPAHTDCPDLDEPVPLAPRASYTAHLDFAPPQVAPAIPKRCGYHDHLNPPVLF